MEAVSLRILLRRAIADLAIILMIIMGAGNILLSLPVRFSAFALIGRHYAFFSPETISIHRTVSTVAGFILIFISYRLFRRMRVAWLITIAVMPVSLILHILRFRNIFNAITIIEMSIILILVLCHKDFARTSDPINLKWGIIIASGSLLLVLLNSSAGFLLMGHEFAGQEGITDAIKRSIQLLFFMDIAVAEPKTKAAALFAESAIILNWSCLITGLLLILKPLVYQPIVSMFDREKARGYILLYGKNPISYVGVEHDKKYFFGTSVKGTVVYIVAAGVAVCVGDPLCRPEDAALLISEFIVFCKDAGNDICFLETTESFLPLFKQLSFGVAKYGEEAMFDLQTYNTSGSKAEKVRTAVNHADRIGIAVHEYRPREKRDRRIEQKINEVSDEWLSFKKSSELSFMLGTVSLDEPLDRRYFYALNKDGAMQGFVVFTPFEGGLGYYADVTRRRMDAPQGVMEKIIISAFGCFREEGVKWGSLGLAPLANARESEEQKPVIGAALEFIYENLNNFYGFKTLHHYKKKFGVSSWEPRYMVYYPGVFTPKIAYSIIKAQNPRGVKDYVLTQLKLIYKK